MKKDELREYLNKDIESLRSLNFSETYIKSVIENTSKWAGTGLLGGVSDPYIGRNVAALLENQRIFNETWPNKDVALIPEGAFTEMSLDNWAAKWRRCSIPVIRRAFAESFIGYQIVSVQTMKSSQENAYVIGFDGKTHPLMMEANTRRVPLVFPEGNQEEFSLDAEAKDVAVFSEALCNDFGREIIRDLALNAGKLAVYEYKNEAHLLSLIEGMSAYISAKCYGKEATWIVTSPTIVRLLGEYIETSDDDLNLNSERTGISKIGVLNKNWRVFEDSTAPAGNILMGLKDSRNHYFSGYVFAPFLPANPVPAWKTEHQESTGAILSRYGKRLINSNFYGTLKIENLPEATPLTAEGESEE